MITVGDAFPQFKVKACNGLTNDDLIEISSDSYEGKWKLFSSIRRTSHSLPDRNR